MQEKFAQAPSEHRNIVRNASAAGNAAEPNGLRRKTAADAAGKADLLNPGQRLPEMSPVEPRPGVGLAAGCDVGMANHSDDRIPPAQNHEEFSEARVLPLGVGLVVGAFEFHAHGKIVAAPAPPPA